MSETVLCESCDEPSPAAQLFEAQSQKLRPRLRGGAFSAGELMQLMHGHQRPQCNAV